MCLNPKKKTQQFIQPAFWGLLDFCWSHPWHSAREFLSLLIVLFYVEMKWLQMSCPFQHSGIWLHIIQRSTLWVSAEQQF